MSSSGSVSRECAGCGDGGRKLDLRPVMVVDRDEPKKLCPRCYRALDAFDMIDHERDAEVFQYAN